MDSATYHLLDYTQYRLYVEEANKNGRPDWRVAYKFRDYFQVPDMSPASFALVLERMQVSHWISVATSRREMRRCSGRRTPCT